MSESKARTWDDWSDFEINKKVAEIYGGLIQVPDGFQSVIIGDVEHYYDSMRVLWSCHSDYCNNWEDIGQIIDEYNITTGPCDSGRKMAALYRGGLDDIVAFDPKTTRAAAIVFLMMNVVEP